MRDNINDFTKQDANEGADGQKVLLQEGQEFLFLIYSHDDDAAWPSWDSLVRNYLK